MSYNYSSGINSLKPQRLINLTSLINPENDKSFEYLCKFFKYTKVESLKILQKISIDDLIKQEKIYHDMILNPFEHNVTRLDAWIDYIKWIRKLFSKEDLRLFLVLENFTKSTTHEKEFFSHKEFITYWMFYVDMCADDIEVTKYMKKNEICTKSNFLYQTMAILYEKSHEFINANLAYLEGFDKKIDDLDLLQASYKLFEERMENRFNREVNSSQFSPETINSYIQNELKKNTQNIHDNAIYNSNNKRLRNFSVNDGLSNINFVIKKKKIEFMDDVSNNVSQEGIHSTIKYGQIPIYVDEPFRKNMITKGTKLVEVYTILLKFLLEKDEFYKVTHQNFIDKLKEDFHKKPVSWLNGLRINPDKIFCADGMMPTMLSTESILYENKKNRDEVKEKPIEKKKPDEKKVNNEKKEKVDDKLDKLVDNKKFENVMNKMMNEVKHKIETVPVDLKINEKSHMQNNLNTKEIKMNSDLDLKINEKINNDVVKTNNIQQAPKQSEETIQHQDGNKYRIMRVVNQNKKEIKIIMAKQIAFNENKKQYFTLEQIRSQFYFENIRIKERKQLDIKNKRKTIVYKIDSDGDMCLSSDEESEIVTREVHKPQPIKEREVEKTKPNQIPIQTQTTQPNHPQHSNLTLPNKPAQQNPSHNLNLFNYAMSIEEINEKIKEVTSMFAKGMIDMETRNNLYNHLEEKIIQIEKLEKEQNYNKKAKVSSFNEIACEEKVKSTTNPFLNQVKQPNNKEKNDVDLISYLEPINSKSKVQGNHNNIKPVNKVVNHLPTNYPHLNPLMELPNSILKKTADETVFSNVSRSLDFTNIKLIDSSVKTNDNKLPFSALFLNENKTKPVQKKEDFSISFDSEHSYMFPNPFDNTPLKDDHFFTEQTPPKEGNKNLQKNFIIRDTPLLMKKNYVEEDTKIHSINHINHINLQLINNNCNNSLKVNEDNKYTDFNNILKEGNKNKLNNLITDSEEENESEVEKKMKLSKLFGDAFGISKKQEAPLNFGYGLSSITEKTTENTYLSDDSIILRKII